MGWLSELISVETYDNDDDDDPFGPVYLQYQSSKTQKGDVFTKALSPADFRAALIMMGVEQRWVRSEKKGAVIVDQKPDNVMCTKC